MFEVVTKENSATITLNDNLDDAKQCHGPPARTETWIIGRDPCAVAWAILAYATKHGIPPARVGYSIKTED